MSREEKKDSGKPKKTSESKRKQVEDISGVAEKKVFLDKTQEINEDANNNEQKDTDGPSSSASLLNDGRGNGEPLDKDKPVADGGMLPVTGGFKAEPTGKPRPSASVNKDKQESRGIGDSRNPNAGRTARGNESSANEVPAQRRFSGPIVGPNEAVQLILTHRYGLSESMFSACQALRFHWAKQTVLSPRELQACARAIHVEWFCTASHRLADPEKVAKCINGIRCISPGILQHIINLGDFTGNTALHYCVCQGNYHVAQKLLESGLCHVNKPNRAGFTALQVAAVAGVRSWGDLHVVYHLFARGNVNIKGIVDGRTALMMAVKKGDMIMVKALLNFRALTSIQDEAGTTALMIAADHGFADILKMLLRQPDCDPLLFDKKGNSASCFAKTKGYRQILGILREHCRRKASRPKNV